MKRVMTQNEYERKHNKLTLLRLNLKEKKITKDEAINTMVVSMHYGKLRAKEIVTGWSRHFYNETNVRHYNPNPVVKISRESVEKNTQHDLAIDQEMV